MIVSQSDEGFSTRFLANPNFTARPSIHDLAIEYGLLCNLLSEINGDLAIITQFKDDGQGGRALEHLNWFLSFSLAQKLQLIEKAAGHKALKKYFHQFDGHEKGSSAFLALLNAFYARCTRFYDILSTIGMNAAVVRSLIEDFESLDFYSEGHERLFELMLGLTDVNVIESVIPKSTVQNTWQGACEGRYAYASSLARLRRFYDSVPPSNADVVYDLGSGYGHSLFYGALKFPFTRFKGVEFIGERVERSQRIVNQFGLTNVDFFASDIRDFDFSDGSVFYLYSPFTRAIKIETFHRLIELGREKKIRLFVYDTDQLDLFEKQTDVFQKVSDEIFESHVS